MLSEVSGPAPSQKRKARSKHLARAQRRRVGDGGSYAGVRQVATIDADASAIPEATANFEAYYQAQCLFTNPADWDSFFQTLRQPLPVTFRVSTSSPFVRQCLDSGAPFLSSRATIYSQPWGSSHGVSVVPPERLDWCGAWQLGCSSLVLKNAQEPRLVALRRWLARWAALGVLTRQEIVSMIPVSFLDVQPGHHVLDMCAAPGSKTTQVLDILQQPGAAPGHGGVVVANDLDPRRGYMLVRRCAAMGLATSRLVVTQHKAQKFPDVSLFPQASPAGEGDAPSRVHPECAGLYDRIVCDVPCCGDGTLRKSPSVWQRWHPQFALGLHSIQLQIAMRGAALLKVGGRMAYSTCTFNPVENEAVVCELLRRCQGSMELVDVSDQHPEVRRAPGLRKWCVFDDEMTRYDTFEETQAKHIPPAHRRRFRRSMFPIPLGSLGAGQRRPPLRRCMRFYPHHQNTGGFFVCILRKVRPLPAGLRVARGNVPRPPRALVVAPQFRFLPAATSALAWLRTTFSIRKQHMPILERCLYSRSSTAGRAVYCIAPEVRAQGYLPQFDSGADHTIVRVVSAGVRILNPHRGTDKWLLTQSGARMLVPLARARVARLSASDMVAAVTPPRHGPPKRPSVRASRRGRRLLFPLATLSPGGQTAVIEAAGGIVEKRCPQEGALMLATEDNTLVLPARVVVRSLEEDGVEPPVGAVGCGAPSLSIWIALTLFHSRGLEQRPAALCDAVIASLK